MAKSHEKYIGICVDTGEEITGYLLRSESKVNSGRTYICPGVEIADFIREGEKGEPLISMGPFYQVIGDSIAPAEAGAADETPPLYENDAQELAAYRNTGCTPEDLKELWTLFKGLRETMFQDETKLHSNISTKKWIERAAWHVKKVDEQAAQIEEMEKELAGYRFLQAERMKKHLVQRMVRELSQQCRPFILAYGKPIGMNGGMVLSPLYMPANKRAENDRLRYLSEDVIKLFEQCPIQPTQCEALCKVPKNESILEGIIAILKKKPRVSYGDVEIQDAIFEYIHDQLQKD